MGHACVNVQRSFWSEPVTLWIATVITTGKPSSISTTLALLIGKERVKERTKQVASCGTFDWLSAFRS